MGRERGRRRFGRSIGACMAVVAALAVLLALVRPSGPSVAARLASEAIAGQRPGFDAGRYRVVEETPSADGRFWRVRFRGSGGTVEGDEVAALIPVDRVREAAKASR